MVDRAGNGWNRKVQGFGGGSNANVGVGLHEFMKLQCGGSGPSQFLYLVFVFRKQLQGPLCGVGRLLCRYRNSLDEECQPILPCALGANPPQQIVVLISIALEIKAGIEKWLRQCALCAQQKCNQQSAKPAIAIEKRVNGLELNVHEASFHKKRESVLVVM